MKNLIFGPVYSWCCTRIKRVSHVLLTRKI